MLEPLVEQSGLVLNAVACRTGCTMAMPYRRIEDDD